MTFHDSKKGLLQKIQFLVLVMIAGIISTLLHELGHCIFYWLQGIPAAMSLTKEFPLKDITVTQHAIGCAGGPLANIFQIVIAYWLYQKGKVNPRIKKCLAALILANAFYFVVMSLIVLLKRSGGAWTGPLTPCVVRFKDGRIFEIKMVPNFRKINGKTFCFITATRATKIKR